VRFKALSAQIKAVRCAKGFSQVFYPCEIEARNDAKNRREGLLLPEDTLTDLQKVAEEYGLQKLLPF
jgi:LDH2 family malate/lactate/ureidoglycolate dehydrogenase